MIHGEVEAALRRLLDENNHLTLAECRDRWLKKPACGCISGRLGGRLGGSTGRERNAASVRLSRIAKMLLRRAPRGGRTQLGLAGLRRSA